MKRDLQTILMDGLYALHIFTRKHDLDVRRVKITIEFEDMNTYSRTQSAAFHEFGRVPTTAFATTSAGAPQEVSQGPIIGAFRSGREFTIWGMRFLIKPPTRETWDGCDCPQCRETRRLRRI